MQLPSKTTATSAETCLAWRTIAHNRQVYLPERLSGVPQYSIYHPPGPGDAKMDCITFGR